MDCIEKIRIMKRTFCKNNKLIFLISLILFVIFYGCIMRFVWDKGGSLINSDASSEMVLAAQLNEEGDILLSGNWFYSSELRVLNTQLVYRIALMISPDNWHLARVLSIGIFLLLLAVSAVWLMYVMGYGRYAFWAAIAVIAPFGRWYGWNVIFNSYYVPHIVISIISIALVCQLVRTVNTLKIRRGIVYGIIMLILGFFAGLGGVRQLMMCYIPLFVTSIVLLIIKRDENGRFLDFTKVIAAASSLLCFASGVGYLVNLKILSKYFSFASFSNTKWTSFYLGNILRCISEWCSLFGWQNDVKIFSLAGIANVVCIFLVIAILFSVKYLFATISSLNEYELFLMLFSCVSFLVDLFIFGCTAEYNESYWIPLLPFAFFTILIFFHKCGGKYELLFLSGYGLMLCLLSLVTVKSPYISCVPNNLEIQKVSEWLNGTDYKEGVASFWNSNVIVEMSDGQIEMWTVEDIGQDLTFYPWLQSAEHENFPEGNIFVLVSRTEYDDSVPLSTLFSDHIIYEDEYYLVYDFNDIGQYFMLYGQ